MGAPMMARRFLSGASGYDWPLAKYLSPKSESGAVDRRYSPERADVSRFVCIKVAGGQSWSAAPLKNGRS